MHGSGSNRGFTLGRPMEKSMHRISAWADVPGYESRYLVSIDGEVLSLLRNKIMKPSANQGGYLYVRLVSLDGSQSHSRISRMVLSAFDRMPNQGEEACHKDGIRTNNRLSNLRWDTRTGNQGDRVAHGTHSIGERNPSAVLDVSKVLEIRELLSSGVTYRAVSDKYGISMSTVYNIKARRKWAHV